MTGPYTPETVPICRTGAEHEEAYEQAMREDAPHFVVDEEEAGYSLAYDLHPTGHRLTEAVADELGELATEAVEAIVDDDANETTEIRHTLGASMGSVYYFSDERTAREFAARISTVVLDEANWEPDPGDSTPFGG
ncbi:hypothetical protein [Haloarchaeobius sp. TZWWS8]|uniref:hypothetical protein n=1 Tax=Haloarchaeobius sp. TZWWS8 TaxID=3446121 RepID=UPI003EBD5D31